MDKKLPYSARKFIRKEKARIRSQVSDAKEKERLIQELYVRYFKNQPTLKTSAQSEKKPEKKKEKAKKIKTVKKAVSKTAPKKKK